MKASMLAILFVVLPVFQVSALDQTPAEDKAPSGLVKWQDSEAGQFVFFAVLEGLYRDGVPSEVVDLVVNPKRDMDNKVKHVFVFECDICHAAYEAFVLYSKRQTFQKTAGRDTFGKGVDPHIVENLKSEQACTRVFALGDLIRPWIVARVDLLKMSEEKQKELIAMLLKYKDEARPKLGKLRHTDPLYKDWSFYGSCQACEAASNIAKNMR